MKKLLVLMMSLMMVFSLAACGGEDVEDSSADSDVQYEADADVTTGDDAEIESEVVETETTEDVYFLSVGDIATLPILEVVDLSGTTWMWTGATVDGAELGEAEFLAMLEAYNGKNEIVFDADGKTVQLVQGGGTADGYCEYLEEGIGVAFDINGTEMRYGAVLTEVDGVSVLLLMPDEASAFYYILK